MRGLDQRAALAVIAAAVAMLLSSVALAVDDGDWPMPAHDYSSTRFSPLDEIKPANVSQLQLAFSFSTGVEKGHEAAPIVVGDTMYVVTPYPNYVFAFDLGKPGANVKWKFDPKTSIPAGFVYVAAGLWIVGKFLADGQTRRTKVSVSDA